MARRFEITCQLTAYDDSDNPMNVGNGTLVTTTRTGDDFNLIRTTTSGTTDTYTSVDLGDVPDGAMEFAISNLSTTAGDDISVALDYSGTKRVIATVRPGDTRVFSLASRPYVKSATASVPYLAGVAVL
jgi:hypothetical protein